MTNMLKSLIVFCEGPHDVAYVRQVLKNCFNFESKSLKFSEYPSPFNQLFKNSVEKHAAIDLSLDMAHKFFLPDKALMGQETLVLLFNSGGKTKVEKIKTFLSDFNLMYDAAKVFTENAESIVDDVKFLFFYDADDWGAERTREMVASSLAEIDGKKWFSDEWVTSDIDPFAATSGNKGIYVWGDTPDCGSLEDLLHPLYMHETADQLGKVESYVDSIFIWNTADATLKTAIAEKSKRKKAIFTILGQREKPGGSMNVIVDQSSLITSDTWKTHGSCLKVANFIADFASLSLVPEK